MFASSATRVIENTSPQCNEMIERETEKSIAYYELHPELINRRLRELDREWDVERVLETAASAMTLTGLGLAIARSRRWLLLSLAVQSFLMQHALQGWCPPLPLLRRLGVRTQYEIERERYALLSLKDKFDSQMNEAPDLADLSAWGE